VPKAKATKKQRAKVGAVMHEFKAGTPNSGSAKGPKIRSRKQAIAVALHVAGLSRRKTTRKRTRSAGTRVSRRK
jgi:hypothetical protein